MNKLIIGLLGLALLAGCGPHHLTPQEQAAQKARDQHNALIKRQHDAAAAAAAKAKKQEKDAAKAAAKRVAYNQAQLHLLPLPAGVHQIGGARFLASGKGIEGLRHVCAGHSSDGGNTVDDAQVERDGSVFVKCAHDVTVFRDETWNNAYNYDKAHGITMAGVLP